MVNAAIQELGIRHNSVPYRLASGYQDMEIEDNILATIHRTRRMRKQCRISFPTSGTMALQQMACTTSCPASSGGPGIPMQACLQASHNAQITEGGTVLLNLMAGSPTLKHLPLDCRTNL